MFNLRKGCTFIAIAPLAILLCPVAGHAQVAANLSAGSAYASIASPNIQADPGTSTGLLATGARAGGGGTRSLLSQGAPTVAGSMAQLSPAAALYAAKLRSSSSFSPATSSGVSTGNGFAGSNPSYGSTASSSGTHFGTSGSAALSSMTGRKGMAVSGGLSGTASKPSGLLGGLSGMSMGRSTELSSGAGLSGGISASHSGVSSSQLSSLQKMLGSGVGRSRGGKSLSSKGHSYTPPEPGARFHKFDKTDSDSSLRSRLLGQQ